MIGPMQIFIGICKDFKLDGGATGLLWETATGLKIPDEVFNRTFPRPAPPDGSNKTCADEPITCADEAAVTARMFEIGDVVRLKSESRMMTISSVGCVEICCIWMNGSTLEEADFHRDTLTKEPHPDSFPF
ncbi:MAG: hypothetical protein CMF72_22720 [Mameliella sp.]|nr:hypothetical protein [Mameliella sp.]|tara:strand:- start:744 stop:1136 length:393 start_codon:yes stop_codon:yes gene_type:complete